MILFQSPANLGPTWPFIVYACRHCPDFPKHYDLGNSMKNCYLVWQPLEVTEQHPEHHVELHLPEALVNLHFDEVF